MVSSITHFATWLFLNQDGILVPSSPRLFKNSSSETESSEKPAHCFNNGTDKSGSGSIFTKSDSSFTSGCNSGILFGTIVDSTCSTLIAFRNIASLEFLSISQALTIIFEVSIGFANVNEKTHSTLLFRCTNDTLASDRRPFLSTILIGFPLSYCT